MFKDPSLPHIIRLILIMLLCGAGGGLINHQLNSSITEKSEQKVQKNDKQKVDSLQKCIFIGLGASFLVPLLLNMISSNLLETSGQNALDYFILAGFCLTASISSRAFITTISEKVLRLAREAKEESSETKKELIKTENKLEQIESTFVEQDSDLNPEQANVGKNDVKFDDNEIKVLKSLTNSNFIFRTLNNIAVENKLAVEDVKKILDKLISQKYVEKVERKSGEKYMITLLGRLTLSNKGETTK